MRTAKSGVKTLPLAGGAILVTYLGNHRVSREEEKALDRDVLELRREFNLWVLPFLSDKLPALARRNWRISIFEAQVLLTSPGELKVIVSGQICGGKRWIHVSASKPKIVPNYADLCKVKESIIGAEAKAIFIFPPQSEHVNIHSFCLHLWHCLDGDGLPDFRVAVPGGGFGI